MAESKKILILAQDDYEDMELHYPYLRLQEAGYKIEVAGPKSKEIYHAKHGNIIQSDLAFKDVDVTNYKSLVIPGGYAPEKLRADKKVIEIVKDFHKQKKPIAFICHAGWVPISANLLKGVRCTSYHTIKDDMINAGAKWVDESVVIDKNFISSRKPDDLPKFCLALINFLEEKSPPMRK